MGGFVFSLSILMWLGWVAPTLATIAVMRDATNETVAIMNDQPARFIPSQEAYFDIEGLVVYADPPNACTPVTPPPLYPITTHWILLVRRKDCSFQTKIENAQNASYAAIIVHNVDVNTTAAMGVEDASKINIFAVFVGEYDGLLLRDNYTYEKGYYVRIEDNFSISAYIIPFTIILGISFIAMLLFMLWHQVVRWVRERRRSRKRRLPASALKKLPTQKWTKGDPYETCAICIEDFVVNDKIRVLPCSHGFHTDCIDPWLTKGRRVCPICKRKVVLAEERISDSDSDSDSETAPLLGASTSAPQTPAPGAASTFIQQRENPFQRAQRRIRTRQLQRPVVLHDSDTSSSENDNDYYESSSEATSQAADSSSSRNSIVAEVHTPGTDRRVHRDHPPESAVGASAFQDTGNVCIDISSLALQLAAQQPSTAAETSSVDNGEDAVIIVSSNNSCNAQNQDFSEVATATSSATSSTQQPSNQLKSHSCNNAIV